MKYPEGPQDQDCLDSPPTTVRKNRECPECPVNQCSLMEGAFLPLMLMVISGASGNNSVGKANVLELST
jgi:hypothetical protein